MENETEDNIYNCDDKDLGAMMDRLFREGNESIQVQHPTDGLITVTKSEFYGLVDDIKKHKDASPADKLKMRKQNERLATNKQIRHRTAMINAQVHDIDIEDGNFGYDSSGNKLDVDDMVFTPTEHYLPGIEKVEGEVGCFIDEYGDKPPVRVRTLQDIPAGGGE